MNKKYDNFHFNIKEQDKMFQRFKINYYFKLSSVEHEKVFMGGLVIS